jgi:glycosyltransferase involved in cell wall biosynthesis
MSLLDDAEDLMAEPTIEDLAVKSGIRRIHILGWRDLEDTEAGGSEIHAARVAEAWAAAGLEVTMRTSRAPGLPCRTERDGYKVVRRSGRHLVFPTAIIDEMTGRLGRGDALLEVWNGVPFFSPIWSRRPKVIFIHHVHRDMWHLALGKGLAHFGKALERHIAPPFYRSTRILTPSEATREEVEEYLGLPPANIRVVGPGVDRQFSPEGAKAPEPTVLAVGRLVPHKKFDDLIRVMPALRHRVPNARLVIIGDGYCREELEQLVDELDARSFVEFRGRVDDEELVEAYRRAWVVTSASIAEGWGMTITEAAACGTPAVVTRVGGHCDAVTEGETGLLVDSLSELTDSLADVLTDEEVHSSLAKGALKRSAECTWTATATVIFQELAAAANPSLSAY